MLNPNRLSKDEYEIQFYGFSTTDFIEECKEVVKEIVQNALTDIEQELINNDCQDDHLEKNINELYLLYIKSIKHTLNKYEAEIRAIFDIPNYVLLNEDKIKSQPATNEEIKNLQKELVNLENQLIEEKVFFEKFKQIKELFEVSFAPLHSKIHNLITIENRLNTTPKKNENSNKMLELFKQKSQQFAQATKDNQNAYKNIIQAEKDFFETINLI